MKKEFLILTAILSISICFTSRQGFTASPLEQKEPSGQVHWSYQGETGPKHWGDLDPAFKACKNGKEQSPININFTSVNTIKKLNGFRIEYTTTPFWLVHTDHTLEANAVVQNNKLSIDNKEYKLSEFHFHGPSEHQLNGQNSPMELHLVHQGANGQFAVIGVMIKEGKENKALKGVWNQLHNQKNSAPIPVDIHALLPANKTFFHYSGSLTIPPCSENVKWVVLENPIEMSKAQIETFKQMFVYNNRPIQPLNNRKIQYGVLEEK